jgi:HEAT repeat protein
LAETPDPETSVPDPEPARQTTPFLVLQFFIFPMAIVAVCVTVFVVFGLIAAEGKSPRDYLGEVRTGSANRRWQAAFELSKVIQAKKDPALSDPKFVADVAALFKDAKGDDPRVRRYLALALGRLGNARAVPTLLEALGSGETDSETQIYTVWALGAIGDPSTIPELAKLTGADDSGIRKAAVHALGVFDDEGAKSTIARALDDGVEDVRWNAAVALARHGDVRAVPVLLKMLDRGYLAKLRVAVPDREAEVLSLEQQEDALLQAIAVAPRLTDPAVRTALQALEQNDTSLKVREAARIALGGTKPRS